MGELKLETILLGLVLLTPVALGTTGHERPEFDDPSPSEAIAFLPVTPWDAQPMDNSFPSRSHCNFLNAVPGVDNDGDGEPNDVDEDDDCDHLADELEVLKLHQFDYSGPINSDALNPDTDADGVIDGRDIWPRGNLWVEISIEEFCGYDSWQDPWPGSNWGDPYLRTSEIRTHPNGPVVAEFPEMWGFQKDPNEAHPHDEECYNNIATTQPRRDTFLPDDIAEYAEASSLDYPHAELILEVVDHDDGSGDDVYDLGKEAGKQLALTPVNLHHVSEMNWRPFVFDGGAFWDQDDDDSARLRIELHTPADACAVDAGTTARHGALPDGIVRTCED